MQLVEKHIISRTHWLYPQLDSLCFLSKNLFNYANYLIRQKFIATGEYLDYYQIEKLCRSTPDYIALPAKVSQQTLLRLHESWQSFFAAMAAYRLQPSKFEARPALPKYKHKTLGRNVVTYTDQAVSKTWLKKGIALNAYYNKQKAVYQSLLPQEQKTSNKIQRLTHKRNCKIDNYLHNASRFIIDCLVANRIGTLVIGKNDGWQVRYLSMKPVTILTYSPLSDFAFLLAVTK